jgi:NAD(P)-dependent dehydrogenase (short-subunit alcohol dehydrogenase family)
MRGGKVEISFQDQVAVVTGGGGGLGKATSIEMARRGAAVVVNDIGGIGHPAGPSADDTVAEIRAAGGSAVASYDSVDTAEGGRRLIELALETFGAVDAILHFAGNWRHVLFDEMTPDQAEPVLGVHLHGAFHVAQPAWSVMKERGYGRIVLTSSSAGAFGRQYGTNYAAAKAGLLGLGRALALEGGELGIFTNCLLPIAKVEKKFPQTAPDGLWADFAKSGLSTGPHPPGAVTERVVPMPTYLASRACTVNGEAFSAGAGRYARVFIGVTDGWLCGADEFPTPEDIAAHLETIEDRRGYIVPTSLHDEVRAIAEQIAARDGTTVS